ncbi:[protein-PII] uridylyltransferase [Acidimicrobiia bacterium EGI L10123]|uniref:[protein-PII] uridylyltransferase n=1 Tax=Salinilacustrithrix flava TaxID=2957203 RepID=UPI003D7C3305|nr:[protein-PII] uridylyltransferase [Acidimicrobiia bacterium EGI L10123]
MDLGRDELAADTSLVGRSLCEAYADRADAFLTELFEAASDRIGGISLVALGGYGRRELSLQSDLDVLLLHDGYKDIGPVADAIWYPVWDQGVKLGHAVRTVKEALDLAGEDIDSATAMLQARHIAGDRALTATLIEEVAELWRAKASRFLPQLADRVQERHARAGEVAFLLEPDLKEGRGGLRDVQSLRWACRAREMLWEGDDEALQDAYDVLLAARVELHRRTGRMGDVLVLEEQDGVAGALGVADADDLMRGLAEAARIISFRSDDTWRRVGMTLRRGIGRFARRDRALAPGAVLRDGEVHLLGEVDTSDPVLPLRTAALAAGEDVPVHRAVLALLEGCPPLPTPWPDEARDQLVHLLGSGRPAISHLESLDQHGLFTKVLPEWEAVRSKPQRNAYHTFTVDRHLCEAAANAAELGGRVSRPDLLVVGTWLHDIGKGFPGDHTVVGMEIVADIGARMGFDPDDVAVLVAMVEHHLLLPDVATRRDLDDPEVIQWVADSVGSTLLLELLHALTEADSQATGPAAWGPWKQELVDVLVRRVEHVLEGGAVHDVTDTFPSEEQRALVMSGQRVVRGVGDTLTVVDADRPGLFSRVTGTLALHGLDVLDANIVTFDGRALEVITVQSSFGPTFAWDKVLRDLERALAGRLALRARLAERAATYRRSAPATVHSAPKVEFHLDASSRATVVEVHAPDSVGVLHRITAAIAEFDLDIVRARVQTLLDEVVDSFYLEAAGGGKVPEDVLPELRRAILHAVDAPR